MILDPLLQELAREPDQYKGCVRPRIGQSNELEKLIFQMSSSLVVPAKTRKGKT
jgi:hypothetical protein